MSDGVARPLPHIPAVLARAAMCVALLCSGAMAGSTYSGAAGVLPFAGQTATAGFSSPSTSPANHWELLRVFGSLALVILLIAVVAWFLRRVLYANSRAPTHGLVQVLGYSSIGPKRLIYVLEIGNTVIVVGCTGDGMHPLAVIDDAAKVEEIRLRRDRGDLGLPFGKYLGMMTRKRGPLPDVDAAVRAGAAEVRHATDTLRARSPSSSD